MKLFCAVYFKFRNAIFVKNDKVGFACDGFIAKIFFFFFQWFRKFDWRSIKLNLWKAWKCIFRMLKVLLPVNSSVSNQLCTESQITIHLRLANLYETTTRSVKLFLNFQSQKHPNKSIKSHVTDDKNNFLTSQLTCYSNDFNLPVGGGEKKWSSRAWFERVSVVVQTSVAHVRFVIHPENCRGSLICGRCTWRCMYTCGRNRCPRTFFPLTGGALKFSLFLRHDVRKFVTIIGFSFFFTVILDTR